MYSRRQLLPEASGRADLPVIWLRMNGGATADHGAVGPLV